jgi:hypothetical protein
MFDFVFFILFMSFFFLIVVDNVKMKIKQKDLLVKLAQSDADNELLLNKISMASDKDQIENTDGFVKFLNQSRDWAFDYIYTVQNGIYDFTQKAGPEIAYFDKYGDVIWTPLTDHMKKISEAYKDLEKLIPEDYSKAIDDYGKLDT